MISREAIIWTVSLKNMMSFQMFSKKKLAALYAKYIFGELTINELRSIAVFEYFSLGSNWYPVEKIRKNKDMLSIPFRSFFSPSSQRAFKQVAAYSPASSAI